ncbi:MAG: NYN domain-containing protein [Pirellulales bacterium]
MSLVIDGYNLLHASGILGPGIGPGGFERSRTALLGFLAESLDKRERTGTTVVFDARMAPPGLPRDTKYEGITVHFSQRGSDADQEIERLIADHTAPRRLTVVSSDHRLHRAARRRRAKAIDSERWYAEVLRRRIDLARKKSPGGKPSQPPTEAEVHYWLRQFGIEEPAASPSDALPDRPLPPGFGDDVLDSSKD